MSVAPKLQYQNLASFLFESPARQHASVQHGLLLKRYKPAEFTDAEWHWEWPIITFKMHCYECKGERTFSSSFNHDVGEVPREPTWFVMTLKCRDCVRFERVFTVQYHSDSSQPDDPTCMAGYTTLPILIAKASVFPALTPGPTKRLKELLGDFEARFRKGLECEEAGLGIGAFSYYRQIVEGMKDKIFECLIRLVALEGGANKEELSKQLQARKESFQFSNAADYANQVLPESVKIAGHNPLTLLHQKLSEGIHNSSDEQCLAIAKSIRVVLVALAERLDQALKEERNLVAAIGSLHAVSTKNNA
jgi:hypothetical protein